MIAGFIISGSGETICVVCFIMSGRDESIMLFVLPFPIVMIESVLPILPFAVTMTYGDITSEGTENS